MNQAETAPTQFTPNYKMLVFTLIWFGQMISIVGSGLTGFGLRVWAFQQTNSVTQFAFITVFGSVPTILLSPIAGSFADRWDKRWTMILTDSAAALATISIFFLVRAGALQTWHIYLASTWIAICGAFQAPAYYAAIPLLMPKQLLSRANGMSQIGQALSQIISPLLAGALVVWIGLEGVTKIDLGTFIFAVCITLLIRIPSLPAKQGDVEAEADAQPRKKAPFFEQAKLGWNFISERHGLLSLLILFVMINFTYGMIVVLIAPLVLGFAGADKLGQVFAMAGLGTLLGAITMSVWRGPKRRINGVLGFSLLRSLLLFLGGLNPSVALIGIASGLYLFFSQIVLVSSRTIWQVKIAPEYQGRVFAVQQMVTAIFFPLGQILAGPLADKVFQPLMNADGAWAGSVGQIIGVGPGRGIGLMFIVLGILNLVLTIGGYLYPRIRLLEDEIPDALGDDEPSHRQQNSLDRGNKNMKPRSKWLGRVAIGFVALIAIVAIFLVWFVRRPWPEIDGNLEVTGLQAPVTVIRDQYGVPNIYADNAHDLFFAQGYVHAQDRLWQMEFNRRTGSGRLSEAIGLPAIISLDEFFRNMRLRETAEKIWGELDPDSQAVLQAYADGVNAYIDSHQGRLPVEYTILGIEAEPWTPIDTLTWGNVISMHLSSNRRLELVRAKIVAAAGMEKAQELIPVSFPDSPSTMPALPDASYFANYATLDINAVAGSDEPFGTPEQGIGSNSWVVSGDRTDTGLPILANDIHLGPTLPSVWYANGLHGAGYDVVGFTMGGVPGVLTGHNNKIAWGVTNLSPDTQDYYIEKLDSLENPTKYEYMGEWHDLEVIHETMTIKGQGTKDLTFYRTPHGPIMNTSLTEEGGLQPLALRWTVYDGNQLFASITKLDRAQNWDEFREAVKIWDIPGQNFLYADQEGNIGFQASGRIPIRKNYNDGLVPMPGWTDENEWQGYIPFDELPMSFNPEQGFLSNANSRIEPEGYPYRIVDSYIPGERAQRIVDLIEQANPMTVEKMESIQEDTLSNEAVIMLPYFLAVTPQTDAQKQAMDIVRQWDMRAETGQVAESIYGMWHYYVIKNTILDDIGVDLAGEYLGGDYIRHSAQHLAAMTAWMPDNNNPWFDNIETTDKVETRDDIILKSLDDGLNWMSTTYGADMNTWTWGRTHSLSFAHQPIGLVNNSLVKYIFNSPTYPIRGSNFAVLTNTYNMRVPYKVTIISNVRHVIDLSNFENSVMMPSTGENGQLYNPHRLDLIPLWNAGESFPMSYSREIVESRATDTLVLTPAK